MNRFFFKEIFILLNKPILWVLESEIAILFLKSLEFLIRVMNSRISSWFGGENNFLTTSEKEKKKSEKECMFHVP